jgi:hypothetical protein
LVTEGDDVGERGGLDAGKALQALHDRPGESRPVRVAMILDLWHADARGKDRGRIEARILFLQAQEAVDEQSLQYGVKQLRHPG